MISIEELEKENIILKKQLDTAISWMKRNIKEQASRIKDKELRKMTLSTKSCFVVENIEDNITNKIGAFFGDLMLLNIPSSAIEAIISAEINYYNLRKTPSADGISVITSYHKSLDVLIESFITKGFRKFAKKQNHTKLKKNDQLEKFLDKVVNDGYILSIGRLFHILQIIKEDETKYEYVKCFSNYIDKYFYIKDALLDDIFYDIFEKLVKSEIFGRKRHSGRMSFVDTRKSRKLLIGEFEDKVSLIYMIMKMKDVTY